MVVSVFCFCVVAAAFPDTGPAYRFCCCWPRCCCLCYSSLVLSKSPIFAAIEENSVCDMLWTAGCMMLKRENKESSWAVHLTPASSLMYWACVLNLLFLRYLAMSQNS